MLLKKPIERLTLSKLRSGGIDTRIYRNGIHRLRARLSPADYDLVQTAIDRMLVDSGCLSESAALVHLCTSYLATPGHPASPSLGVQEDRDVRKLFKLYPDQYSHVRATLTSARGTGTDEDALVLICRTYLEGGAAT